MVALTAATATSSSRVQSREGDAIKAAKQEVIARLNQEIESTETDLKTYQRKSQNHLHATIICCILTLCAWVIGESSRILLALFALPVLLGSVYQFSDILVLYLFDPNVRNFLKKLRDHWTVDEQKFQLASFRRSVNSTVISLIRDRVEHKSVKAKIRDEVGERITSLNSIETLFHNVFGSSQEEIARRIHEGVLEEVDFNAITERLIATMWRVLINIMLFSLLAVVFRYAVVDLSGFEYGAVALFASASFIPCFLFRMHRLKSIQT
ncbi:MAG: hypothetical protein OXC91_01070 [Rhodobacteraceae bacterium]|nr:hypothetical protein [Paracoccaceae bacterium]